MSFQALSQPESIGRVLDSGFKLFVASLKSVFLLVVVTAIISVIMQYAIFQAMVPPQQWPMLEQQQFMTPENQEYVTPEQQLYTQEQQLYAQEQMSQHMMASLPQVLGITLIMWIVSIILYNAILSRVGDVAAGGDGELYDALIIGIKKLFPVFFAAILYSLAVSIGFVLLVIPGLIIMITLLFFQVLIVVDDEGIIASLKHSHNLVWGNYWRTTAVILIPVFIVYALIMVVAIAAGFFGAMSEPQMVDDQMQMSFGAFDIVMAVVSVLAVPFLDSVFVVHVNDLKLRKSGSDLEQRMSG
ncbi:MAG: hypothetical protein HKP12_01135 [Gammaproteobacteria bacterium]|nr:hypothetical protein [Gammaproteobacteria bacterium]